LNVHSVEGPRVGAGGVPVRQPSSSVAQALRRLVVEELPVDHHHGGVVAGRVALDVLEADAAVGRRLVVADAEVLLGTGHELVAAEHRAQRVGADADVVLPGRPARYIV
jgi:hypothetical protein